MTQERTQTDVHAGADRADRTRDANSTSVESAGPDGVGVAVSGAVDGYDFERLERSVDFLIEEHQRLSAEREALLEELVEREQRLAALESELESERRRRLTAVEGVDKILGRLAQLQTSVSAAVESA